MPVLNNTPPWLVKNGNVVDLGLFRDPFKNLNILDADIFGTGTIEPQWFRRMRLKEWQHFAVISEDYFLGFVVMNSNYLSMSFCYVVDRKTGKLFEHHREVPGARSKVARELFDDRTEIVLPGYAIRIANKLDEGKHSVSIDIAEKNGLPAIRGEIELREDIVNEQPLVVVLPIADNRPLYTHKMVCPVSGSVTFGNTTFDFDGSKDLAMLDVQKTFYPHKTMWKWATCAGYDTDGHRIALNLVQNMIADDDRYNENVLWVDGKMSRWGGARFELNPDNTLAPWKVRTTDGGCDLQFTPLNERAGKINLGVIMSDYHQPFGLFSGTVKDEDGKTYTFENFFGVTEYHKARF